MRCTIGDSWIPSGNMIQSSPTQEKGVALELGLRVRDGFSNPLLAFDEPISSHNPIAHIAFDFETKCADDSCALYFIEVGSAHSTKKRDISIGYQRKGDFDCPDFLIVCGYKCQQNPSRQLTVV